MSLWNWPIPSKPVEETAALHAVLHIAECAGKARWTGQNASSKGMMVRLQVLAAPANGPNGPAGSTRSAVHSTGIEALRLVAVITVYYESQIPWLLPHGNL